MAPVSSPDPFPYPLAVRPDLTISPVHAARRAGPLSAEGRRDESDVTLALEECGQAEMEGKRPGTANGADPGGTERAERDPEGLRGLGGSHRWGKLGGLLGGGGGGGAGPGGPRTLSLASLPSGQTALALTPGLL